MAQAGDGKPRSDRRRATNRIGKRVTDEELRNFKIRAAEAGFSKGQDYLSALIAGDFHFHAVTRKDTIRVLGELGKLGSNINQIAKAVNQGRIRNLDAHAVRALEETRLLIEALGQEIRETLQ
ncbi:plasmid mobilization relaxosome protein MobC [Paracoccaceae bacterium Fryx2]|nr:plasmid mobilization relaxosome protein MobC [Paracoccaceae bacterium Fryx2]